MAHQRSRLEKWIGCGPHYGFLKFLQAFSNASNQIRVPIMSEAFNLESASAPKEPPRAAELAAHLAARMCHDFISPASAIVSGLDLLDDPTAQDMRDDAMSLIGSSARKLADLLAFSRVAFGASASAETFDARALEGLARGIFAHMRADLDWLVTTPGVNKPTARALLNLAQLGGAALPTGGVARVRAVEDAGAGLLPAPDPQGRRRARIRRRRRREGDLRGDGARAAGVRIR
jgi:histidine phosphotransferase ChpT